MKTRIICCRYWKLQYWESVNMAFPYWRLYWNRNKGSCIKHQDRHYELGPDVLLLIPPHTSFSTHLVYRHSTENRYLLQGERIVQNDMEQELIAAGYVLHLYIHFKLGMPFDTIAPAIYSIVVNGPLRSRLERITSFLPARWGNFSFTESIDILSLITESLAEIPEKQWHFLAFDTKILRIIDHIEEQVDTDLSNTVLAGIAGMARNSFIRLFTSKTGMTPQHYVQKARIEKASVMLLNSKDKMEHISRKCGYKDRYYFSRSFKRYTGISPARYRNTYQNM
ncbi:MAG: helix-turn-helix transcriptional regulator [Bacteroidales bacterium]|nr:helix-turn-helix transcriptional regulator [Bacteroidales bacterium]